MEFFAVIFLAVIVEGIVEWVKTIYQSGRFNWPALIALLIGVVVCIGTGVDLFKLVGVPIAWPILGQALTGILISRGSNYIHDFLGNLGKSKTSA